MPPGWLRLEVVLAFALADRIKLLDGQRDQALAIAEETKAREKHRQDQLVLPRACSLEQSVSRPLARL